MNDLDKQRLLKSKPEIDPQRAERIAQRLNAFSDSDRYPMFQGLCVAQFFSNPDEIPDSLQIRTLEELCNIGGYALSLEPEITDSHLRELEVILEQLLPEDEKEPKPKAKPRDNTKVHARLNSVEAERLLHEGFDRLRQSDRFEAIKHIRIEQYWSTDMVRAPFIESLTFRELLELSIDNLLKKRSFGDNKIHGLLSAIENVLNQSNEDLGSSNLGHSHQASSIKRTPVECPKPKWLPLSDDVSPTLQVMLKNIEDEREASFQSISFAARILRDLIDRLTQEQFVVLWFAGEKKHVSGAELLALDDSRFQSICSESMTLVKALLEDSYYDEFVWCATLLQGIGTKEDIFQKQFDERELSPFIRTGIMRMILTALGGRAPQVLETSLDGYWTKRPDGLFVVLSKISKQELGVETSSEHENDTDPEELLSLVTSQFDENEIQELLRNIKECH